MGGAWFESVREAERRARRRLPRSVYKALVAGSERGQTLRENIAAFSELGFAPHVAGASDTRELSTTVLGQPVALPVLISRRGCRPCIRTANWLWPAPPPTGARPWG